MFDCSNEPEVLLQKEKIQILIVEDSRIINDTLANNLKQQGYVCFQSYDLESAKKLLSENEIFLLILDLHLPDGDGEELIYEVQANKQDTKIVIFTSDNDLSRRDELFRMGVLDYILKGKNAKLILKDIENIIYNIRINPFYTILIVDDSVVIRQMIKKILSPAGYRLVEAKNGQETFEMLQQKKIDLVLLDMEMPEMNGMEILKKIKESEENFHLPVFVISSNLDIETMRNAYKEGALDYFKKPFSPEELKLKVEQVVKHKRNEERLKCTIETTDICKEFLLQFYANAIFYANARLKWSDAKFQELFGKSADNMIQIFEKIDQEIMTDMIIAMKHIKTYKNLINLQKKQYSIKLFPLKNSEFLVSVEELKS